MEETREQTESTREDKPATETEPAAETETVKRRSPRRRSVELEKQIAALKAELEREVDRRLRVTAEYENYRRRTQTEFGQLIQGAGERIIKRLLPILDDFERLFNNDPSEVEAEALRRGAELIYKKLESTLSTEGLQPMDALHQQFDAEVHEAVAQMDDSHHPAGMVVAEVEKGYRLGDKIIRHPRVVVSREPRQEVGEADG